MRNLQATFFTAPELAYGGSLLTKRKARLRGRPLSTKHSMHLVLRSTQATGAWSFRHNKNRARVERILAKFAKKYGIRVLSLANAGNHLHLHIWLSSRQTYKPFIRAITAAIAMAVTGVSRWRPLGSSHTTSSLSGQENSSLSTQNKSFQFWDRRPFTRVVIGFRNFLGVRDYIRVNQLEGDGLDRSTSRDIVFWRKQYRTALRDGPEPLFQAMLKA